MVSAWPNRQLSGTCVAIEIPAISYVLSKLSIITRHVGTGNLDNNSITHLQPSLGIKELLLLNAGLT